MELVVQQLKVSYTGLTAVNGVDLNVAPGQIVAIVGPNGCGKSTLLRSIARLHKPDAGRILVGGEDIWKLRPKEAATRVAFLPQAPQAPEAMTVGDLVRYGRHPHQGMFQQWSRTDERVVGEAMAATGVLDLMDRRVDQLSGGQRQRCWVAMVMAQEAPVMLLDEPTSMLDIGHQLEVLNLVRTLATQVGRTLVLVLHDLISAARFADVLVAMREGQVVASGAPRDIVTADLVRRLYDVAADILRAPSDGAPVVVASHLTGQLQLPLNLKQPLLSDDLPSREGLSL